MASGPPDPQRPQWSQERGCGGNQLRRTQSRKAGKGEARSRGTRGSDGRTERGVGGEVLCRYFPEVSTDNLSLSSPGTLTAHSRFHVPWLFFFSRKSQSLKSRK